MITLTRDIRQVIDRLEPTIQAECPSCGEYTAFSFLKDQRWPPEIAEMLALPSVIALWTCASCHSTISETELID